MRFTAFSGIVSNIALTMRCLRRLCCVRQMRSDSGAVFSVRILDLFAGLADSKIECRMELMLVVVEVPVAIGMDYLGESLS